MNETRADEQRALYGSTLAERFGSVMQSYGLTQRALADVLGLSAPMLSQLMSAQRIKIGNPAVYERLVMLEVRASETDRESVLDEVRSSEPVLSSQQSVTHVPQALASLATAEQLSEVAAFAHAKGAPQLSALLREASRQAERP